MITDQLVNEIYWAPSFDHGYTYGSRISVSATDVVTLSNPLLAFGKALMTWTTSLNWQSSKEVSQLPILQVGQKYRIAVLADFKPAASVITRLTFYDLQGSEIKQLNLVDRVSEFTCPPDTVDYQLELINAGCVGLTFRRIEIGPADLPLEANQDLWLQAPINSETTNQQMPVNLLVMGGGKRMKRTYQQLRPLAGRLPVQSLLVAWQSRDNVSQPLQELLVSNNAQNIHLISCEPRFDQAVVDVCQRLTASQALITNKTALEQPMPNVIRYAWEPMDHVLSPGVVEQDWPLLFHHIHQVWGGDPNDPR